MEQNRDTTPALVKTLKISLVIVTVLAVLGLVWESGVYAYNKLVVMQNPPVTAQEAAGLPTDVQMDYVYSLWLDEYAPQYADFGDREYVDDYMRQLLNKCDVDVYYGDTDEDWYYHYTLNGENVLRYHFRLADDV